MEWKKPIAIVSAGLALIGPQIGCSPSTSDPIQGSGERHVKVEVDTSHSPRLNDLEKEVTRKSFELTKKRFSEEGIHLEFVDEDSDIFMEYATVHKPVNWLLEDYGYTLTDDFVEKIEKVVEGKKYARANIERNITYMKTSLEVIGDGERARKGVRALVTNEGQFIPSDTIYVNVPNNIASLMEEKGLQERSLEDMVSRGEIHWNISNTEMHEIGHVGGLIHFNQVDKEIQSCNGADNNLMDITNENISKGYNEKQIGLIKQAFTDGTSFEKALEGSSLLNDLETFYQNNVDIDAYCGK